MMAAEDGDDEEENIRQISCGMYLKTLTLKSSVCFIFHYSNQF